MIFMIRDSSPKYTNSAYSLIKKKKLNPIKKYSSQRTVSDSWSLKEKNSLWDQRRGLSHSEVYVAEILLK